jgi:2-hydroxychromene-2-carboxylate isomerase
MAAIEYFYSAHSLFAYFGSRRLMEIATAKGRMIWHKPYDLDKGMAGVGATPFGERSDHHVAYYFGRELERWSEERNAPVVGDLPTHHRKDMTLPNCMLIAGIVQNVRVDELSHVILQAHWRDDADITVPETLAGLAWGIGVDPAPLIDAASAEEIRAIYESNTEEAIRRSVFGWPTYFVDGDMFYGQDRLEMVERALQKPYRGSWPRP